MSPEPACIELASPERVDVERSLSGADAGLVLRFSGDLGADDARAVYDTLRGAAGDGVAVVRVELSAVENLDTVAAAALKEGSEALQTRGTRVVWSRLGERQRSALDLVAVPAPATPEPGSSARERGQGKRLAALFDLAELMVDTWTTWVKIPLRREKARLGEIADQAVRLGVDAFPVVALLSFLTGLILAFQAAFQLRRFGAEPLVAEIVGLGMSREFGALMTAIILSGRSGAALAAELGTMAIREEIDALRTMGINPISFLVVPRVVALGLLQPILTIWATGIGIAGGLLTTQVLGLPTPAIFARMQQSLKLNDFTLGVGKSVMFAGIIAFTGCYLGLRTRGGARSVGDSTTRCTVISILLVVLVDSIITTLWTNAGYGRR
jgi:phospholipid/cholesterol/gamma-HCH transport system permease protein